MAASTAVSLRDTSPADPHAARTAQVASLTGLRGFAALMVVLIHTSVLTAYPWIGVPEYGPVSLFVLSGFLLFRPWARWTLQTADRPSLRVFARRRVARIFPAYLVVLVVVAAVEPASRPEGVDGWLRAASLTWIYSDDPLRLALFQTWSLGTETSWYVALPLLGGVIALLGRRLPARRALWLAVGLLALSVPVSAAWRWWITVHVEGGDFTYPFWLPGYLVCFASGALVALLLEGERAGLVRLDRPRAVASDPWLLVVVAVAAALVGTSSLAGPDGLQTTSDGEHQVRFAAATVMASTLLVAVALGSITTPLNRLLSSRGFVAIGRWSYGIYLWHLPLIVVLDRQLDFPHGPAGLLWRLVVVLGVSVPLAAATFVWVEQPAIAWSHRRGGSLLRRRASPLSSPPTTETTSTSPQAPAPTAAPAPRSSAPE